MHLFVLDDITALGEFLQLDYEIYLQADLALVWLLASVLSHVVEQVPSLVVDFFSALVLSDEDGVGPHGLLVVHELVLVLVPFEALDS